MPYKDPEARKEYLKQYYQKKGKEYSQQYYENNKEKILEQRKEYREKNKEKLKQDKKEWHKKNIDTIKEKKKKYLQTDNGKKYYRIGSWRKQGVKSDDFDALYEKYINTTKCDKCNVELVAGNYGANKRCLDHNHETGEFRFILCNSCNLKYK